MAIPTRPTADSNVHAADAVTINRIYQTLSQNLTNIELLTGYEGDSFASTGNFVEDLLAISAVHPMRKDALLKLMEKTGADWNAVQALLDNGTLREIEYQGHYFYLRIA